ncbi:hypothetical protein OW493_06395 [Cobetia sp. 14N.309.X.WAT.E.A4]|uniref:P-loop ATPase, Sll1717 family n=1 Tax=Cobetia sp. 14N.309.X.WAT.E.A4 TaxID=2998323 RepID=UPI0025B19B56|nr:hypothetical protein [Cobetia sp. 14N.309.X.WAT.E.A4]MDN2656074.1 hypothetical protein [Cobetia sp. 14N.309.X.WAT.E.A4]
MHNVVDWLPEFEISAETDGELLKYFIQRPEINKVVFGKAWLVLGKKGSGKTAIHEYLKSTESENIDNQESLCINFRHYPWPAHQIYKEALGSLNTAYQKSWSYLITVKALSKLIELKSRDGKKLSKELVKAKSYIEKIYGSPNPTLKEVLLSKVIRLKSVRGPSAGLDDLTLEAGEFTIDDIASSEELQSRLRTNAFTLLEYFESVFRNNSGDYKILIALDQLDENWLEGEIEEYSRMLVNLLNVCSSLSLDPDLNSNLKVVVFLRTDIYQTLKFNDKNKLIQGPSVTIEWDHDSLNDMFYERIRKYAPPSSGLDETLKSNCVFSFKMARQKTPPFKHIIKRSFNRPRDIIVYFNKLRAVREENKGAGLYSSAELYSAEIEASTSIYNELIDEWSALYPEIEDLLGVLQLIEYETFDKAAFEKQYRVAFPESSAADMMKSLKFLFENSIIGQKHHGRWVFRYNNLRLLMNQSKDFKTHPSLKHKLSLLESRPSQRSNS